MKHRAKTVVGNFWVQGKYEFISGRHLIRLDDVDNYPLEIRQPTLEAVKTNKQ